jgi:hypothetical protein
MQKTAVSIIVSAGLLFSAALNPWNFGCSSRSSSARHSADLCVSNLLDVYWIIRWSMHDGIDYPPTLASLARETDRTNLFVCPGTGHKAGNMRNVEDWTDYIYVGNERDTQDPNVALVISPPENHGDKFGIVLWHGGNASVMTPAETRQLIDAPWCMATNAPQDQIDYLKSVIDVRIPERLRSLYPNAYRASGRTNPGSNGPANGEE